MPNRIETMLRRALTQLQNERARIDRQLTALQEALGAASATLSRRARKTRPARRRRRLSAAGRNAIRRGVKAYWAKRRARSKS